MSEKIKVSKIAQLRYRSWDLKTIMIEKWQVVLLICLFWAGMLIGCIFINGDKSVLLSKIERIIESGYAARTEYTGFQLFKNSLLTHGLFLVLSYFFGMSAIGYPFICLIPLLCGVSNGMVTGFIYSSFGIKGFLYCLTTVYPGLVIALVALIIGSCEALHMSVDIFRILSDKNRISTENSARKYGYQFCILSGIIILSAVADTVLCNFFLERFNLF